MAATKPQVPPNPKRKEPEQTVTTVAPPVQPPTKVATVVQYLNWRTLEKLAKPFIGKVQKSGSKFGGYNVYVSNGDTGEDIRFTTAWLRVAHDPSVWDETKNSKFGKKEADGKVKELDPNRKFDKWSLPLIVTPEFSAFLTGFFREAICKVIYANRDSFTEAANIKAIKDPSALLVLVWDGMPKMDAKLGHETWPVSCNAERGSSGPNIPVIRLGETAPPTGEASLTTAHLGAASEVAIDVRVSFVYVKSSIKIHFEPARITVRALYRPRSADASGPIVSVYDD